MIAPDETGRKGFMRGKSAAHTSGRGGLLARDLAGSERDTQAAAILRGGSHSFVN
jgi:hypothetical protein